MQSTEEFMKVKYSGPALSGKGMCFRRSVKTFGGMTIPFGHTRLMMTSPWYAVDPEFYVTQEGKCKC